MTGMSRFFFRDFIRDLVVVFIETLLWFFLGTFLWLFKRPFCGFFHRDLVVVDFFLASCYSIIYIF